MTHALEPRRDAGPQLSRLEVLPGWLRRPVVETGRPFQLLGVLLYTAVREPVGYWRDTLDEMYGMLRFTFLPVLAAVGGFTFLIGNLAYGTLTLAGAQSRVGTYFVMADVREIAPFTTAMAVAGVMGTAMCADLGSRKIREELDAMQVLGVEVNRVLVLPRVLAVTVMTTAFNFISILLGISMAVSSGSVAGNTAAGSIFAVFFAIMNPYDLLIASTFKSVVLGLFIGTVCAQKGLNAAGGPQGVGRAVNQAVVQCFVAIWIINFVINTSMLGLFPELQVNR
ncbi:MAG: ABC transporter permease [Pseudonocardia sp.]|nr:ABC transporter permease [Pseudonocardia sp.]